MGKIIYGADLSGVETTEEKVQFLLSMAPKTKKEVDKWIQDKGLQVYPYLTAAKNHCFSQEYGIPGMIVDVIEEREGVTFHPVACENGKVIVGVSEGLPWAHREAGVSKMTSSDVYNLLNKYIQILTEERVHITYYEESGLLVGHGSL